MAKDYSVQLEIANEAFAAARKATEKYIAENGEWYPCGFAWTTIRPGNCRMAQYLKSVQMADNGYHGGMEVWNPSGHITQNMDAKEAGARAFAEVLKKHGIKASVGSRLD